MSYLGFTYGNAETLSNLLSNGNVGITGKDLDILAVESHFVVPQIYYFFIRGKKPTATIIFILIPIKSKIKFLSDNPDLFVIFGSSPENNTGFYVKIIQYAQSVLLTK